MELYLLRHAVPEGRSISGKDSDRELSTQGRMEFIEFLNTLRRLRVTPDKVICSPFVRARQTAELLALEPNIELDDRLRPDGLPIEVVLQNLAAGTRSLLLIGHQPSIGDLAAMLLSPEATASISIDRGSCCKFEIFGNTKGFRAGLLWLVSPKDFQ